MIQIKLTDNFDQWRQKINFFVESALQFISFIGNTGELLTNSKTTLVAAINELHEDQLQNVDGGNAISSET